MAAARPHTRWERATLVSGDFNGDGLRAWAMVGYTGSGIELAVRVSGGKAGRTRTQLLAFGIDSSAHRGPAATAPPIGLERIASEKPSPEEVALWQRRLASQANHRAWSLSEQPSRTPEEDEEMLQAAHAAMYFWRIVGTAGNHAHVAQLVAHAYASLKLPGPAAHYLAKSQPVLMAASAEPWERALAHAVAANVASARGQAEAHGDHYRQAVEQVAAFPDAEERAILEATLRVLPVAAG